MAVRHDSEELVEHLGGPFPGAVVLLVLRGGSVELLDVNQRALTLLSMSREDLLGSGFSDVLFEDDALTLAVALVDPDESRPAFVLRWGTAPPVHFLGVDLQGRADGTVLAALHDQTDAHRLDAILSSKGLTAQVFDNDGIGRWVSPNAAKLLGIGPEHYLGRHSSAFVHPDDRHDLLRADKEMRAYPGNEIVVNLRTRHPLSPDGWEPSRNKLVFRPDDPAIGGFVNLSKEGMGIPVDDASRLGPPHMTVGEMMPSGLIISGGGRIMFRNGLSRRILGLSVESPDPHEWVEVLRAEDREAVHAALDGAATEQRSSTVIAALERTDHETLWLRIETMPSFDAIGSHVGYAATLLDVTVEHTARVEMERTQEQLWRMANHDGLTGLPNRMHFHDRLGQTLARTRREGRSTAVLFCDLDHFKQVNDQHGHAAGDTVLVEIARRLAGSIRETDTVCRLGGDEFVIVCEAFEGLEGLSKLTRRLIDRANEPIPLGNGCSAHIGLCVGIAVATATSTADELLARADGAAYQAKQSGRNAFVTAD